MRHGWLKNWRPHPAVVLLALAGMGVCTMLSAWQYQRGQAKAAIEDARVAAGAQPARAVAALGTALPLGERLRLQGRWEPRTLLLDNQTAQGRPGAHVWTLFRLESGQALLVDRGWTPLPGDRQAPVRLEPTRAAAPVGLLRDLPTAALAPPPQCPQAPLPRLNYPSIDDLRCTLGEATLLPALLLLDAQAPGAYRRAWQRFEIPPSRHYGYAVQWAALALTIAFLFLRFNRRPAETADD